LDFRSWAFGSEIRLYHSSRSTSQWKKTNFEGLEIYQLAEKLADNIRAIVVVCDYFAKETVSKQIVKAADSIGATYRTEVAESYRC
jgi:hypothetical protein